jgi:hypothetical protein
MLRHDNRRWDVRNEHDFSSISLPAGLPGGFIGIGARFASALLLTALTLSSCDETKTTTATQADPAPAGDEMVLDRPAQSSEPREIRWSPDGDVGASEPTPEETQPILVGAPGREGWAIVLTTFTGQDHRATATRWMALFQEATSMPGAWIETDERGSTVRYGSYPAVESKQAQQDLSKIKNFVYKEQFPFAGAHLSRYGVTHSAGRLREFHLSEALKFFPGEDTVYSLQIGVYEAEQPTNSQDARRVSVEDARRLAEEAVMQLRGTGEMAFYYHGPHRSMVCVGAFPPTAVDGATGFYSPEVSALQQRFPYNSFNGRSLKQEIITMSGQKREELQPSFLVQVPKE